MAASSDNATTVTHELAQEVTEALVMYSEAMGLLRQESYFKAAVMLDKAVKALVAAAPLPDDAERVLMQARVALANALLAGGKINSAVRHLDVAIEALKAAGLMEDVLDAMNSLFLCKLHAGEWDEAADVSRAMGDVLDDIGAPESAVAARARGDAVAAGWPKNRIVVLVFGQGGAPDEADELEVDDALEVIRAGGGGVRIGFKYQRNRPALPAAEIFMQGFHETMAEGEYDDAAGLIELAAKIDVHNPDPHYHTGRLCLVQHDYTGAKAAFERAQELAPGWHSAQALAWLASCVADGTMTDGIYEALQELDELEDNAEDSAEAAAAYAAMAQEACEKYPLHPLVYNHLGSATYLVSRDAEAAKAHWDTALEVLGDADLDEIRGVILTSKAAALEDDDPTAWRAAMELAAHLGQNAMLTATMAKIALATDDAVKAAESAAAPDA
ncbi:uncharacterized protein AMSG_04511 [Thecamonas trahens ATCC 50062]|uniref:Tetratricopeptide repeat protein n=1 Tax=Thecamonas trahens ATCC 50062 TaxID=461836 RepID=A0A0L0D882_THETB|nr:hypothetical protein AMSG_04511 [Thecamonas trahens ATCC 50062]KNC48281.1 hypothetical protein AMSG_04511 [Thecamonas trahens ATCC 50062]|eukprot:XP_013758848.1 hypothetical protein AMSG_04511 [Thecamonas trahens ATCC 50062]